MKTFLEADVSTNLLFKKRGRGVTDKAQTFEVTALILKFQQEAGVYYMPFTSKAEFREGNPRPSHSD